MNPPFTIMSTRQRTLQCAASGLSIMVDLRWFIRFREHIVVHLPPQKHMEQCHIYLEFSHCSTSEKLPLPFAFAFMHIMNPRIYTIVRNGRYFVGMYEYSKKLKVSYRLAVYV